MSSRVRQKAMDREKFISPMAKRRRSRTLSSRRSISVTPNVASSGNKVSEQLSLLYSENDDVREKQLRQQNKVLELQRQNMPSPLNPRRQAGGASLTGLTNNQIAEHYKNCIKLSSENKITAKNAFGLHLIDYMSEMLQEREGMTNFQMASCTLDASTKIYAYRVDCMHADAYKMVGGLSKTNDPKGKKEDEEADSTEEGKKKKKNVKRSKTIVPNVNALNIKKFDTRFDVDPLFKKMSETFDEGGIKSLLLNSLKSRDDGCELILDSSSSLSSSDIKTEHGTSHQIFSSDLKILSGVNWNAKICPPFHEFRFRNWNPSKHDVFGNDQDSPPVDDIIGCKSSENHAFDLNAVPEPIEENYDDGNTIFFGDAISPSHDDDDDDNDNGAWNSQFQQSAHPIRLESVDALAQILSDQPSDYSYFDTHLLSAWAGPNHWKVKPFSKETRQKREVEKKLSVKIDYDGEIISDELFKPSVRSVKLERKTLQQWSVERTTMPEDLHYDINGLTRLFLKSDLRLRRIKQASEVDDGIGHYNYNNPNDCENFCPVSQESDDSDGGYGGGFDDDIGSCTQFAGAADSMLSSSMLPAAGGFTADNLLQQPYKVAKIDINYARTAKKVDVQKVKSKMWSILTDKPDENNKENVGKNENSPTRVEKEILFSELYNTLPSKVSPSMAKNLSVPLTFVCFLHLVNEKCLKLVSTENMKDFIIKQDI
ncbi:Uncharacterised protein g1679 [Pycnogonum litorale]